MWKRSENTELLQIWFSAGAEQNFWPDHCCTNHNHPFIKYNTNPLTVCLAMDRYDGWVKPSHYLRVTRKYKAWCPFRNYPLQSKAKKNPKLLIKWDISIIHWAKSSLWQNKTEHWHGLTERFSKAVTAKTSSAYHSRLVCATPTLEIPQTRHDENQSSTVHLWTSTISTSPEKKSWPFITKCFFDWQ